MTLVYIAWFLVLADTIMTYFAIKKYGTSWETNKFMEAVMKIDYKLIVALSIVYGWGIYNNYIFSIEIGFWEWVAIYFFPGLAFIANTVWYTRFYWRKRK